MASTTLPSIQEMFPEHLLSKENRGTSKSPASKSSRTQEPSACTVPGCDCSSASSSSTTGRSRCSSAHRPHSRHTYPGSSVALPLPKSPESAVSGSKSSPVDSRPALYEPSRSSSSSAAPVSVSAASMSGGYSRQGSAMEHPVQTNSSSLHPPTSSHFRPHPTPFSHPRQHLDDYRHQHSRQHQYPSETILNIRPSDLPYNAQSRSPPYASRAQVSYPYPPRPGSSEHNRPGDFSHQIHQIEEDELDGDDYDDGISSTPGTNANGNPNTSTRKHVCPTCFKRFNRPSSLKIHVNTHTGATPFRCPWPNCGREFNVNSNMRRHYRNHLTPSRNQGIFPLAPPPTSSTPPSQVPALVPATHHDTRDYPPALSRSHQPHQLYTPPSSSNAPLHNPIGPSSDHFSDQAVYRSRSHTHSLSAGSERYSVYHDQYHRPGQERGIERPRLVSNPSIRTGHSQARQFRGELDAYRPSSSQGASYGHHESSSSTRPTMAPSPPTTHSSPSETGNSDVDMDVDGEEGRFRYSRPSRARQSPRIRIRDHNDPYHHSAASRHRPPPLPLDHDGMEVDPSTAYMTPASKHSVNGVDVDVATRRPVSPAGSSFRSSSPSPSLSTTSTRSPSRSLSRERQAEDEWISPRYNPSKPYSSSSLSGVRVSTTLRPAFA